MYLKLLLICATQLSIATPSRVVNVSERLIGSNSDEYAVIRTEIDNHGSYYISQEKQYLDVYKKTSENPNPLIGATNSKLLSSTLLFDQKHIQDAELNHTDPDYYKIEQLEMNKELSLAQVLKTYPYQFREFTEETKVLLEQKKKAKGHTYGFIWEGTVKEKLGVDRNAKVSWSTSAITQDNNCIYLTVNIGGDESRAQRIICIPPKVTKQFRDQIQLENIVIIAGVHETQEDAEKVVNKIINTNKEKKGRFYESIKPAIWVKHLYADKTGFVVIASNSNQIITKNKFSQLKAKYGMEFDVQTSAKLQYKVK